MYNPTHFQEPRIPVLHGLMRAYPFATLVTLTADGLAANHLPLVIDAEPGPLGTLRGHVARANPVWRTQLPEAEALAIFQGPHGYISPSLYPSKAEHGKVVPTWNYTAVHAAGPLRVIDDAAWLRAFVTRLTEIHEAALHEAAAHAAGRPAPWQVSDAPEAFIEQMLKAIVGIEIPIARLEGKRKQSQNRPPADRAGVVAGLSREPDPARHALADAVAEADRELALRAGDKPPA